MNRISGFALLALAACGSASQTPVLEARAERCSGNGYVEVTNDWNRPVDVYAYAEGSSTGSLIGTVQPGQISELLLPRDAVSATATLQGLTDPVRLPSRARASVRLRYVCR